MSPIHEVLSQFPIGTVGSTETIKSGLMHSTYAVDTSDSRYILQRLCTQNWPLKKLWTTTQLLQRICPIKD